jgi:hypothetical protein
MEQAWPFIGDRGVNEPNAHGPKALLSWMRHQTRTTSHVCDSSVNDRHGPRSKTRRDTPRTHFRSPSPSNTIFLKRGQSRRALSLSIVLSSKKVPGCWDILRDLLFRSTKATSTQFPSVANSQCIVSRVVHTTRDHCKSRTALDGEVDSRSGGAATGDNRLSSSRWRIAEDIILK